MTGVADSYLRLSSRQRERGDSIRRQTTVRDAWLARHPGVRPVADEVYADLGTRAADSAGAR